MNADLALTLMISALNNASAIGTIITQARSENRDVSDAELDAARALLDQAITKFQTDIALARSGMPPVG